MAKCGCAGSACFCVFADSDTVTVTGVGSASEPFVASAKSLLTVGDTSTLDLDLEIAENTATLTAQPLLGANVAVFTADGTWNKPAGVKFARVMMIGGGGGGASGQVKSGNAALGGGGGDSGQVVNFALYDTEIPISAAVVIGQGGVGGAAVDTGVGNNGLAGGDTSFDVRSVRGGAGGRTLGLAPVHLLPLGSVHGQWAVAWNEVFTAAHYWLAPGAGGVGEGYQYGAQPGGYSHAAQGSRFPGNTGGGTAGGGHGRNEPVSKMGGGGGGGAVGTAGGNGGLYGAGGGGGGYQLPGNLSGAGGNGSNGICVVISW